MTAQAFNLRLVSILTAYDRRQAGKRYHNPYALGIYIQAAERATELVQAGTNPRQALMSCFNDRLLSAVLRGFDLPDFTTEEAKRLPLSV